MKRLAVCILAACGVFGSRAETWQDFVRARAAAGATDLEIRRDLVRPYTEAVTNEVTRAEDTKGLERRLKDVLVPTILTGPQWESPNRAEIVIQRFELRQRQAVRANATDADRAAWVTAREKWVEAQVLIEAIRLRGGDPFGGQSGKDTEDVVSTEERPPRWNTLKPVGWQGPPPSVDDIRKVMGGGQ